MKRGACDPMTSSLKACILCGRRCGADRIAGARGACGAGMRPKVARWLSHMGEEPCLVGSRGSGTIFFSGCSLRCLFCQNYTISQLGEGEEVSEETLTGIMTELEEDGCHNVNLVSPTHYTPQIASAIDGARERGMGIPVVYNTHGYDTAEALSWMEGRVDVYLADVKYADDAWAERVSGIREYTKVNREALRVMFDQVGHLQEDPETGLATRGLMVRILILPERIEGAKASLLYLKEDFSTELCMSLMAQYAPLHRAGRTPPLGRTLQEREYDEVVEAALSLGFQNLWCQEPASADVGIPDFSADTPFSF